MAAVYAELRAQEVAAKVPHSYTTARTLLSILRLSLVLQHHCPGMRNLTTPAHGAASDLLFDILACPRSCISTIRLAAASLVYGHPKNAPFKENSGSCTSHLLQAV